MSVTKTCNKPLAYVREHCPSLTIARATLLPFESLIMSETAGEEEGVPHFEISVIEPGTGMVVHFKVTAESVSAVLTGSDDENDQFVIDEWPTTLTALWDYLRQLPRPAHAFRRNTRKNPSQ